VAKGKADSAASTPAAGSVAPTKSSKPTPAEQKSGFSPVAFFEETKQELSKVVWPSRQQLLSESFAVILMVSLSASVIYLVDQLFSWISRQVFG
jgi:preprotein translocase subunit SecE